MELAVTAQDLWKRYGNEEAVRGIDFHVPRGLCFGFLGPNGAGKSSTMRMLYARTHVTSGTLWVLGFDVRRQAHEVKRRVGVVPQENNLDPDLTVSENLVSFGRYYGLSRSEAMLRTQFWLERMGLADSADKRADALSGGMQRRVVIARALLHEPELVVLDEPTTGLDPHARHLLWQRLDELRGRGVTLILTTHDMDEAQRLSDELVVMHHGRILAQGAPGELVQQQVGAAVLEAPAAALEPQALEALRRTGWPGRAQRVGERLFLYGEDLPDLIRRVQQAAPDLKHYLARPATLEDVFLALSGEALAEADERGRPT